MGIADHYAKKGRQRRVSGSKPEPRGLRPDERKQAEAARGQDVPVVPRLEPKEERVAADAEVSQPQTVARPPGSDLLAAAMPTGQQPAIQSPPESSPATVVDSHPAGAQPASEPDHEAKPAGDSKHTMLSEGVVASSVAKPAQSAKDAPEQSSPALADALGAPQEVDLSLLDEGSKEPEAAKLAPAAPVPAASPPAAAVESSVPDDFDSLLDPSPRKEDSGNMPTIQRPAPEAADDFDGLLDPQPEASAVELSSGNLESVHSQGPDSGDMPTIQRPAPEVGEEGDDFDSLLDPQPRAMRADDDQPSTIHRGQSPPQNSAVELSSGNLESYHSQGPVSGPPIVDPHHAIHPPAPAKFSLAAELKAYVPEAVAGAAIGLFAAAVHYSDMVSQTLQKQVDEIHYLDLNSLAIVAGGLVGVSAIVKTIRRIRTRGEF